jgi:hypothetical protein
MVTIIETRNSYFTIKLLCLRIVIYKKNTFSGYFLLSNIFSPFYVPKNKFKNASSEITGYIFLIETQNILCDIYLISSSELLCTIYFWVILLANCMQLVICGSQQHQNAANFRSCHQVSNDIMLCVNSRYTKF